jgi:hypothetical protein
MPPSRRDEVSGWASQLLAHDELDAVQRQTLVAAVTDCARALPYALLDERQSAAFADALCWAAAWDDDASQGNHEAIRSAAKSLAYDAVRDRTVANLNVTADAHAQLGRQTRDDEAARSTGSPAVATTTAVAGVTPNLRLSRPLEGPGEAAGAASPRTDVAPPVLPDRAAVEASGAPVAGALQSLVIFATPDKREENAQLLTELLTGQHPSDSEAWGRLAFIIGVYARNFPVHEMSKLHVLRLWDATRWAVWYEYWFREKSLSSRINQLVGLLQRLPAGLAAEMVARAGGELRTVLTLARPKAVSEIAEYLQAADLDTPLAHLLLAEARERRSTVAVTPKLAGAAASVGHQPSPVSPVAPALVVQRTRELLDRRLTRAEAADAIKEVWGYLDPQHDEANRGRLQRAVQGDARPMADLVAHACQSAEWRLRRRAAVGEDDVRTLCALALHAAGYSGDRTPGLLKVVSIYGLDLLNSGALGVEGYANLVAAVCEAVPESGDRIVEHAVEEGIRQLDDPRGGHDADTLQAWAAAGVAWIPVADPALISRFVATLDRRDIEESIALLLLRKAAATAEEASDDGLAFLSAPEREVFEKHYRRARVYEIAELLAAHEASILETLSASLASPAFSEYRPPTKSVTVNQGKQSHRFVDLKRMALSGNAAEAREARDAFARAAAGRKEWERRTLREWRVYAAMQVDVFDAIPEWLEAFNSKTASLEEQWNLSVFHAGQREYATALTFLQPSVSAVRSSYEYLVFACYLAIQVVLRDPTSADAERARTFLIENLRGVLAPEAQLLWIVLANRHRDGTDVMQFSDAIRTHRTLCDTPLVLPPANLSGYPEDFAERVARLEPLKDELRRLKMTKTWRLWLNDVLAIQSNERWFQVWDWAASACEEDGDINAAVIVLRRIARSTLRDYNVQRGQSDEARKLYREKRVRFLLRVLIRLCELARKHDRDNLLKEIVEEYVKPVKELLEPKGQNRTLHGHLQGLLPVMPEPDPGQGPLLPPGPDALWGQLGFVMADISGIKDLDGHLRHRIENALDIYPGGIPRGRPVAEALRGAVSTIWGLGNLGGTAEGMPDMLDSLAASLDRTARDVERLDLTSLRVLTSMMMRVVRSFAEESCSPPVPAVVLQEEWIGYPSDTESSSVVVDLSFPGPGVARNVSVWMSWDRDSDARFETVGLAELAPGHSQCLSLPSRRQAQDDGAHTPVEATVFLQYDWSFMNRVQRELTLAVPVSDFVGFLAHRHIGTQEFPDPFVVDGPLTRSDVQTSLFQGRVREIDEVRRMFAGPTFPNAPLCFYGIRRTGKTSLLRRIDAELDHLGVFPVEVSLNGIVASVLNQEQVFGSFFAYVQRAVNARYPEVAFAPNIPTNHLNPLMLVDDFFDGLVAAFADRGRVVLLLDEFQVLIAAAGEPLLDSLRPVCERAELGLIVFANQGQDLMINMPGQLALQSRRVDFLSATETADAVRAPLELLGVSSPPSTLSCLYDYTAGHPNFTMKLAKIGLATLNVEHRNVLSRNDIENAAKEVLRSSGLFTTSWFSNKNLTSAEEDAAIKFAKIGDVGIGIAVEDDRLSEFDDNILRILDRKLVLQASGGRIKVRGRLLAEYLRGLIGGIKPPAPPAGATDRVGLFIDLENVVRHIPPGVSFHDAGLAMQQYAAKFGEVKVRFAVAAPWNIQDWHEVKLGLESSGIRVSEVSSRLRERGVSKANLADMYLNDQINEEVDDKELTTIVIATGDKDFLGMIEKYFDRSIHVQMLGGAAGSTARLYTDLAKERRRHAYALGRLESDFDVAFLEDLLVPAKP